jgi:flagellar motor switch protein FliM
VTIGVSPATMIFPPTDRPSTGFVTRFERTLRAIPDDVLGAPWSLALSGCVEAAFGDCLASIQQTSRHIVISVAGMHGLVAIPDAVQEALVEFAFGGDGSEDVPTPPAPTRLAARLGYRIATMVAEAVAPAMPGADVAVLGATDVPAEAVAMNATALACGFELRARDRPLGAIGVCLPVRALAAIENTAGGIAIDEDWEARIGAALGSARVKVRCVLARPTMTAGAVARLAPGSVIPIAGLGEVALIAGGYRIATGIADAREGRAAIEIIRTEFGR